MFKTIIIKGLIILLAIGALATFGWAGLKIVEKKETKPQIEIQKEFEEFKEEIKVETTSNLWGVRAEDLKMKEIIQRTLLLRPERKIIELIPHKTETTKKEILSPDGNKKVRIEKNEIVIIDNLKKGIPTETRIKQEKEIQKILWVPDSKKIAYIVGDELWITDTKGKENKRIVKFAGSLYDRYGLKGKPYYIEISPNEEDIVYNAIDEEGKVKVEVLNLKEEKRWVVHDKFAERLQWSSDGRRIFIYSFHQWLCMVNKDGSEKIILNVLNVDPYYIDPYYAVISPDGKKMVFCWFSGLWIMDLQTKEMKILTTLGQNPLWSPDSKKIVYDTRVEWKIEPKDKYKYDAWGDIWMINVDGTGKTNLTNTSSLKDDSPSIEWFPEWIDDETIIFQDEVTGEEFIIKLERK